MAVMKTIEPVDFNRPAVARKVGTMNRRRTPMAPISIMSVIGSAVPASLRELGLLACWYVVREGEPVSGPFTSLPAAKALADCLENPGLCA